MMKLITLLVLFICALGLVGCNQTELEDNKYKLEVVDNWNLLMHPLEKEYEAGSTVEVHLAFRSGPSVGIVVNDEVIVAKEYSTTCDQLCEFVRFTMPNEDTIIYTQQNGNIAKSCGENKHQYDEGKPDVFSSVAPPPIIYTCKLCGHRMRVEQNIDQSPFYLNGKYYGECIYEHPALSSLIDGKYFEFNENKFNDIECKVLDNIDDFFTKIIEDPFHNDLTIDDFKNIDRISCYELSESNGLHQCLFIFNLKGKLYLFEANYKDDEYTIWRGYILHNPIIAYTVFSYDNITNWPKFIGDSYDLSFGERRYQFVFDYNVYKEIFEHSVCDDSPVNISEQTFDSYYVLVIVRDETAGTANIQYSDFEIKGFELYIKENFLSGGAEVVSRYLDFVVIPKYLFPTHFIETYSHYSWNPDTIHTNN